MRAIVATAVVVGLMGAAVTGRAVESTDQIANELQLDNPGGPSRGLGQVKKHPAAPAASTHQASVATVGPAASDQGTSSLDIRFATGSAEFTPEAISQLDQLGPALLKGDLAGDKFRIEGHTDTVGSVTLNKSLSEQRAQAVVGYLVSKFAIAAERLEPVGMGEGGLAVTTGDQVPEARNRRVKVVNLGA